MTLLTQNVMLESRAFVEVSGVYDQLFLSFRVISIEPGICEHEQFDYVSFKGEMNYSVPPTVNTVDAPAVNTSFFIGVI